MEAMEASEVFKAFKSHEMWLDKQAQGKRIDLVGEEFNHLQIRWKRLRNVNLTGTRLYRCYIYETDLGCSDLIGAKFDHCALTYVNLNCAFLQNALFSHCDLSNCTFEGSILKNARFVHSRIGTISFQGADLAWAEFTDSPLVYANLQSANVSGVTGLLSATDYLKENFEWDDQGVIVYKIFNYVYQSPDHWVIEPGSFISETVNPDRSVPYGCGINVTTKKWIKRELQRQPHRICDCWRCRIRFADLPSVVVPFKTEGVIRCGRLELIERIDLEEVENAA